MEVPAHLRKRLEHFAPGSVPGGQMVKELLVVGRDEDGLCRNCSFAARQRLERFAPCSVPGGQMVKEFLVVGCDVYGL